MANKKFVVELGADERELILKGKASAKVILKARILLKADQGEDGKPFWWLVPVWFRSLRLHPC